MLYTCWLQLPRLSPHHILCPVSLSLCLSSCSTASIWWCLMRTQSMRLLSAWTIRTHGKELAPPPLPCPSGCSTGSNNGGKTLQPVHMIWLPFSVGLSLPLKSGIRGVHRPVKGLFTKGRLAVNHRGWSLHNKGWEGKTLRKVVKEPPRFRLYWRLLISTSGDFGFTWEI